MRRIAMCFMGISLLIGMTIPAIAAEEAVFCGEHPADIVGTPGPDVIEGTSAKDEIAGLGGDDTIRGFGAIDRICGGGGDDVVYGLHAEDELWGGPGNDQLYGGELSDSLYGGPGDDLLDGGPAGENSRLDWVLYTDAVRGVRVDLTAGTATGQGNDTLVGLEGVLGSAHDDLLKGDAGPANGLYGRSGDDIIRAGGGGDDSLNGDAGDDKLFGSNNSLPDGSGFPPSDSLHPGPGDDLARGRDGRNFYFDSPGTDGGDDVIRGGDGRDFVQEWSGPDSDIVRTFGGADEVLVGDGDSNDRVYAGRGEDRCFAERRDFVSSCKRMKSLNN